MSFFFDANGFLTNEQNSAGHTNFEPAPSLLLPRFIEGSWSEGILRRAFLFDSDGYYVGVETLVDPRITPNATSTPVPPNIALARFINGEWKEAAIGYVAVIDELGFLIGIQYNVDPRTLNENQILTFPSTSYVAPQYVNDKWVDRGITIAAVLDADGYLQGYAEKFDPRLMELAFTEILPNGEFITPRFISGEWQEAGIRHAWKIDAEGYFVSDMYNFDPRTIDHPYTTAPLESGVFRKPQFVDGAWIEAHPILPAELLANAKAAKRLEIEAALTRHLTAGVPFQFGDRQDTIQTRFERDLINISGVTTRAILLQSQGVDEAEIQFRAESNTTYLLTPSEAIQLGQSVAIYNEEIYTKVWDLKDRLDKASTINDVAAIKW